MDLEAEDKQQAGRVRALADSCRATWPDGAVRIIETHISRVLLAGRYAYKFKRPLNLGFVDYSTLERRQYFCDEELRLNRRTAPDLYLERVSVAETTEGLAFGATPAVEFAVKMLRFSEDELMSRMHTHGRLQPEHIDALARSIAAFHLSLTGTTAYGDAESVLAPMEENFWQIRQFSAEPPTELNKLEQWTDAHYRQHRALLGERHQGGFIRECHGDLHLNNIVFHNGRPQAFDGIEFNPQLRFIDTVSEIAFLTMDLFDRNAGSLAWRFLNRYLEWTGDFVGLRLLRFYQVYRAIVRAKVAAIRLSQIAHDRQSRSELDSYLALACRFTEKSRPFLLLTCGLSGSGKTTLSQPLIERLGAVRVRSDVERKRLFDLAPDANSASTLDSGIYTPEATRRTYDRLESIADQLLTGGTPALVDATFLKREERDRFALLAQRHAVPFLILQCQAPESVLRERVARRHAEDSDASEADLTVLVQQLAHARKPAPEEPVITIDTSQPLVTSRIIEQVKSGLGMTDRQADT
ncbi:bifunctional aminoglycoside phosphotransferase/ATP-binding protein [Thiohalomonas denitrificans]|uniref:bifunctional aminoglycoside phosphotransferase/ATP-binding protein n=1 Tax=Thiohalomonas denitrificans TaxID=415747 RepID=UPI0026EE544F|nr:bifunctional aminoglycoside phosphotransferase/ATP-binding protein [Thiohalomonas denitrificans]